MSTLNYYEHSGFRIGSKTTLTQSRLEQILPLFEKPAERIDAKTVLGGRRSTRKVDLDEIGPVVVKQYYRGGILRFINKRSYLNTGTIRSQKEFEMLSQAARTGISVPEPILFASKGKIIYQTWLITKMIENAYTLAELCVEEPDRTKALWETVLEQIARLVRASIHHVDLHPGNVMVDNQNRVYILDFDKAYTFKGATRTLRLKYVHRWQRALDKYGLPASIQIKPL